jgi:hypothetical protein
MQSCAIRIELSLLVCTGYKLLEVLPDGRLERYLHLQRLGDVDHALKGDAPILAPLPLCSASLACVSPRCFRAAISSSPSQASGTGSEVGVKGISGSDIGLDMETSYRLTVGAGKFGALFRVTITKTL